MSHRDLPVSEAVKRIRRKVGSWAAELVLALQPPTIGK